MKHLLLLSVLALTAVAAAQSRLFVDPNTSQPTESPRSPSAIAAKAKYDASVKKDGLDYKAAIVACDKEYISALADAENASLKDGLSNKSESDRLDAARLAMVDQMKADQGGAIPTQTPLEITSATWGTGGKMIDVTDKMRECLAGGKISVNDTRAMGDPAQNQRKSLVVIGLIGGQKFTLTVFEATGPGIGPTSLSIQP